MLATNFDAGKQNRPIFKLAFHLNCTASVDREAGKVLIRDREDVIGVVDQNVLGQAFDAFDNALAVRQSGRYGALLMGNTAHAVADTSGPRLFDVRDSRHPKEGK